MALAGAPGERVMKPLGCLEKERRLYVGSPIARERIAADLDAHRLDLTLRKQILWQSETATDAALVEGAAPVIPVCS
jgi:hypothetical protein